MTFDRVLLFFLLAPPVLWMIFNSHQTRSANQFIIKIFRTLLLLVFCLPGFAPLDSGAAAATLAIALANLSDTDLRQERDFLG